jgi:prepilin peptidase CpaA
MRFDRELPDLNALPCRFPVSFVEKRPRRPPSIRKTLGVDLMSRIELLPLVVVALATIAAAMTDIFRFKVYNVLTFPMLFLGILVSTWLGGWGGLTSSLLGAGLGFGLLVVFFAVGGVGAGDVKLLTAVGAWIGPLLTYQVFVASALFGGLYALILVFRRGGVLGLAVELIAARRTLLSPGSWRRPDSRIEAEVLRPDRRRRLVPFAAMTCLGFFATMAWWSTDLERVWPSDGRPAAVSTASNPNSDLGGSR